MHILPLASCLVPAWLISSPRMKTSPQFLTGVARHGKTSETEKIKSLIFQFVPYTNTDKHFGFNGECAYSFILSS